MFFDFVCCALALFTYRSVLVFAFESTALLTVVFLGTNHSFSSYADGGMETQWQTCLFVGFISALRFCRKGAWSGLDFVCFQSAGTRGLKRLDSTLLLAVVWPDSVSYLAERGRHRPKIFCWRLFSRSAVVLVGIWLIWKYSSMVRCCQHFLR